MKLTNRFNLPGAFIRALEADPYSKGEADFSVTELIGPARMLALIKRYDNQLEEDASQKLATALGTGWHKFIERGARPGIDIVEKRYYAKFGDYTVGGQIDLLETDTGTLIDWKTAKMYGFSKKAKMGMKDEYIQQLNMQLELLRANGLDAKKLQIWGVLKDYQEKAYPEILCGMVKVDIPIWPRQDAQAFIIQRIQEHNNAKKVLPECTNSEHWGGRRCKAWCLPASFCIQYQKGKQTGLIGGEEK